MPLGDGLRPTLAIEERQSNVPVQPCTAALARRRAPLRAVARRVRAGIDWDVPRLRGGDSLEKEVIQPQLPLRLPCYDFVPVASPTFGGCLPEVGVPTSSVAHSHDVTGGVYKAENVFTAVWLTCGY